MLMTLAPAPRARTDARQPSNKRAPRFRQSSGACQPPHIKLLHASLHNAYRGTTVRRFVTQNGPSATVLLGWTRSALEWDRYVLQGVYLDFAARTSRPYRAPLAFAGTGPWSLLPARPCDPGGALRGRRTVSKPSMR